MVFYFISCTTRCTWPQGYQCGLETLPRLYIHEKNALLHLNMHYC